MIDLDFRAGASPLASRQNPIIYFVIVIALIILAFFFVIWLFWKKRHELKTDPKWIESEKKRITNKKDVKIFAERHALTQKESTLLFQICSKYEVQNINHSVYEENGYENAFKLAYHDYKKGKNELLINEMFHLKFKLDKIYSNSVEISSTKTLNSGLELKYLFQDGTSLNCKLIENAPEYLAIEIPEKYFSSNLHAKELSKVAFSFFSSTGISWAFVSRIIRYETLKTGQNCIIITHSTELMKKTQKNNKRKPTNEKCSFTSTKMQSGKNGTTVFIPSQNKYNSTLQNISGSGCCLVTQLPIKENQIISIELNFPDGNETVLGQIVKTRKTRKPGIYNLHIKFRGISIIAQNKIYAKVYSYKSL